MHKCSDFIPDRTVPCLTVSKHSRTLRDPEDFPSPPGPAGSVPVPRRARTPVRIPSRIPGQRVSEPAQARAARPASSRATGTRNGEQDT
ncbi:hypothetical protein GCM10014719_00780 [Planomonospora parontospora subsp. antibiotica]|nr:hypothetical protein GCM10014719_00780 [Planomonospora parontospora subsp. antibiotica]GII16750.1 hypothetical protein Ppa05_34760 [Planomonospora parontospora subsp. antibiotica]